MSGYLDDEKLESLADGTVFVTIDDMQSLISEVRELRAKVQPEVEVCGYTQGRCWLNQGADRAKSQEQAAAQAKLCVTPIPHNGYECRLADGKSPYPDAPPVKEAPDPKWQIRFVRIHTDVPTQFIDGWEPFAVDDGRVYLRRQV